MSPKSVPELYPLPDEQDVLKLVLAGPVLRQITAAWKALDKLERRLPGGPDRWQADSLFVAREGMRRAWLALSNLDRGLRMQGYGEDGPSQGSVG